MIKTLLKKTFLFSLIIFISLLVIFGVLDLYVEWRLILFDINGDTFFSPMESSIKGQTLFMDRYIGIPYSLGILIISPYIVCFSFIASLILVFFEQRKLSVVSKMENLFSKPIAKGSLAIQVLISLALEIIAGAIIFTAFFHKATKYSPSTLIRQETPWQIIICSAICYFFSVVTVLLANNTLKHSFFIRIGWIILVLKLFLLLVVKDYMKFDNDSLLFSFIPLSMFIPLCTISTRKIKDKRGNSLIFFIYFILLWILIYILSSLHPFGHI